MEGTYSLTIDHPLNLVRITLAGFFSPADVAAFTEYRRLAYRDLQCAPNQHVTLVDMRGTHIQSQEAVSAFAQTIANPGTKSRRIAFVVSKSLARLQVKRAAAGCDANYFLTVEEAEDWLLEAAVAQETVVPVARSAAAASSLGRV